MTDAPVTVGAVAAELRHVLRAGGVVEAEADARVILEAVGQVSRLDLATAPSRPVDAEAYQKVMEAAQRRIAGEPVHRIIGWREFYGLRFALSADTLEPRPDTETIVDLVLDEIAGRPPGSTITILDLGTGTGAIGLALLSKVPDAVATLTDLSTDALRTARGNAASHGLAERARFVVADWLAGVEGRFDVIVSNPPYIPTVDINGLQLEVRAHDPLRALDGGEDGLAAYRAIAAGAEARLTGGGIVCVEIGQGQMDDVGEIFRAEGFTLAEARSDLGGVTRALLFRR